MFEHRSSVVRSTFLVVFDVEKPFEQLVVTDIKALGDWARMTPTVFMLTTDYKPERIMERLQPLLGPQDSLWIVSPSKPWTGYGDPMVADWLSAALGEENGNWIPKDWDETAGKRQ